MAETLQVAVDGTKYVNSSLVYNPDKPLMDNNIRYGNVRITNERVNNREESPLRRRRN